MADEHGTSPMCITHSRHIGNGSGNENENNAAGTGIAYFECVKKNHRMNAVQDELSMKLMIKVLV